MKNMTIDFNKIKGPVYTGRPRGESLRKQYDLDQLDTSKGPVEVVIPDSTYSVTSSFFLGFFGPSIVKFGSSDAFFDKYHFKTKPILMGLVNDYVSRALQQKKIFSQ